MIQAFLLLVGSVIAVQLDYNQVDRDISTKPYRFGRTPPTIPQQSQRSQVKQRSPNSNTPVAEQQVKNYQSPRQLQIFSPVSALKENKNYNQPQTNKPVLQQSRPAPQIRQSEPGVTPNPVKVQQVVKPAQTKNKLQKQISLEDYDEGLTQDQIDLIEPVKLPAPAKVLCECYLSQLCACSEQAQIDDNSISSEQSKPSGQTLLPTKNTLKFQKTQNNPNLDTEVNIQPDQPVKINDIYAPKSKWKEDDGTKNTISDTKQALPTVGKTQEIGLATQPVTQVPIQSIIQQKPRAYQKLFQPSKFQKPLTQKPLILPIEQITPVQNQSDSNVNNQDFNNQSKVQESSKPVYQPMNQPQRFKQPQSQVIQPQQKNYQPQEPISQFVTDPIVSPQQQDQPLQNIGYNTQRIQPQPSNEQLEQPQQQYEQNPQRDQSQPPYYQQYQPQSQFENNSQRPDQQQYQPQPQYEYNTQRDQSQRPDQQQYQPQPQYEYNSQRDQSQRPDQQQYQPQPQYEYDSQSDQTQFPDQQQYQPQPQYEQNYQSDQTQFPDQQQYQPQQQYEYNSQRDQSQPSYQQQQQPPQQFQFNSQQIKPYPKQKKNPLQEKPNAEYLTNPPHIQEPQLENQPQQFRQRQEPQPQNQYYTKSQEPKPEYSGLKYPVLNVQSQQVKQNLDLPPENTIQPAIIPQLKISQQPPTQQPLQQQSPPQVVGQNQLSTIQQLPVQAKPVQKVSTQSEPRNKPVNATPNIPTDLISITVQKGGQRSGEISGMPAMPAMQPMAPMNLQPMQPMSMPGFAPMSMQSFQPMNNMMQFPKMPSF